MVEPHSLFVDTIEEIDVNPYILTTNDANDYDILRRYPLGEMGDIRTNTGLRGL